MNIYILLLLKLTFTFIIKTRSDGRYISVSSKNKIKSKKSIYDAAIFKAYNFDNTPENVIIRKENSKLVWENLNYGTELGLRTYDGKKTQVFRIILDSEGFFHFGQGKNTYLEYDSNFKKFNIGPHRRGTEQGFILVTNDGKKEYPNNNPELTPKEGKSKTSDYLNQLLFPFLTRSLMYD